MFLTYNDNQAVLHNLSFSTKKKVAKKIVLNLGFVFLVIQFIYASFILSVRTLTNITIGL